MTSTVELNVYAANLKARADDAKLAKDDMRFITQTALSFSRAKIAQFLTKCKVDENFAFDAKLREQNCAKAIDFFMQLTEYLTDNREMYKVTPHAQIAIKLVLEYVKNNIHEISKNDFCSSMNNSDKYKQTDLVKRDIHSRIRRDNMNYSSELRQATMMINMLRHAKIIRHKTRDTFTIDETSFAFKTAQKKLAA